MNGLIGGDNKLSTLLAEWNIYYQNHESQHVLLSQNLSLSKMLTQLTITNLVNVPWIMSSSPKPFAIQSLMPLLTFPYFLVLTN